MGKKSKAIVLSGGGGDGGGGGKGLSLGGGGGAKMKDGASSLLWLGAAVGGGRKLMSAELEKIDADKKLTQPEKAAAKRKLAFKVGAVSFFGLRTLKKGDMLHTAAMAGYINACVAAADTI